VVLENDKITFYKWDKHKQRVSSFINKVPLQVVVIEIWPQLFSVKSPGRRLHYSLEGEFVGDQEINSEQLF